MRHWLKDRHFRSLLKNSGYLAASRVVAVGPHARAVEAGDRVLYDPEDKAEVEVQGEVYVVMRERDIHAVAAERLTDESAGLYL